MALIKMGENTVIPAVVTKTTTLTATANGNYTPQHPYTSYSSVRVNVPLFVGISREVSPQGVYQKPTTNFTFQFPDEALDIGTEAMPYAFEGCQALVGVDFNNIVQITGNSALRQAFRITNIASADMSKITKITGIYSLYQVFAGCSNLTSVDLSGLEEVTGQYTMYSAFDGCGLTGLLDLSSLKTVGGTYGSSVLCQAFQNNNITAVDLSSLETITGDSTNAMRHMLANNRNLANITFPKLKTIAISSAMDSIVTGCTNLTGAVEFTVLDSVYANNAFRNAFAETKVQSVSFPALTSTSFGSSTSQFTNMLYHVTGCAVHFPSNLQSVIGSWTSVTQGFGGTNTTVLFDLPATT